MGRIKAICISGAKGTKKCPVASAELIENHGIKGDAHAGNWHRQISLLAAEEVLDFNRRGGAVTDGDFGENLLAEGLDFSGFEVGSRLICGQTVLEITQFGKVCHSHCAIYDRVGECIMPTHGVFACVKHGGVIQCGDEIHAQPADPTRPFTAAVITMSDKGAKGEREDVSGPAAVSMLTEAGYEVLEQLILPDDPEKLKMQLIRLSDSRQVSLILTTGGTGFSSRDSTPEATLSIAERSAPGIAEAIRSFSMQITKRAMLSRGVAVIRGKSLIINLPGSPKAVREGLGFILSELPHGLNIIRGSVSECAR